VPSKQVVASSSLVSRLFAVPCTSVQGLGSPWLYASDSYSLGALLCALRQTPSLGSTLNLIMT